MLIEIRKAGFRNKGAELMQKAILEKLSTAYPDAALAMAPSTSSAPYEKRARLGLYQKAWLWKFGFQWGRLAGLVPKKVRNMYGVVLDKEVDVVLDASGFSYSDQWGVSSSLELANASKHWRREKKKTVVLPQAFGPFTSRRIRKAVKTFVDNVDLIYAREKQSYEYLIDVVGKQEKIKISPDFTNLVEGVCPSYFDKKVHKVCIVPNYRMVDKTSEGGGGTYLSFLIAVTQHLQKKGHHPFLLLHEGFEDKKLADELLKVVHDVPVIVEADPYLIKGIIGQSQAMIGGRFHGLVSALSQSVPSLATGWSHKYEMLFKDYGLEDSMLDLNSTEEAIAKIDFLLDPSRHAELKENLGIKSQSLKEDSAKMWDEIFEYISSN